MSDKKEGIDLIIDRMTALRARVQATMNEHSTPPTTVLDERMVDRLGHWDQLVTEALKEAVAMKLTLEYRPLVELHMAIDHITAILALPATAPTDQIISAMRTMIKRLQELETRSANFSAAHAFSPKIGGSSSKTDAEDVLTTYTEVKRRLGDDEPRPSWVMERLEGLVLGGWLGDAVVNLERCAEYMCANEERMSEDVFDELRRIAMKLDTWAEEIRRGNMFPRQL